MTVTEGTQVGLKELDDEIFESRYGCDRFTATVLASRYRYTVQHMCTDLLQSAFSVILRDWYDFAATISAPPQLDYAMPAVSNSLVLFIGTMTDAVRNTVEEFGVSELREGDVVICNDPYRSGTHVNDVLFCRPVFHEGELVAFVNLQAHMLDMGGVVPAGFAGTKLNVYENGLVLGPMLLYRDDKPVKEAWNLIFDNTRFGAVVMPDIKTIFENLKLGERLLHESIERYGLGAVHGSMTYACDVLAETMSGRLAEFPDGDYVGEATIDCDGVADDEEYTVKVVVKVRGARAEVDFSGSSRQARTSINAGWLDTKTAVAIAFKYLFDPGSPFTSGAFRPMDIVLPEGTFFSALPPDGPIFLYWESSNAVLQAIFRALAPALGVDAVGGDTTSLGIHNANGVKADGTPWVSMAQCGGEHGPWAATKAGDADSYTVVYMANNIDPATEAIEADYPVVVARKEITTDTAGAGYHRGGAGILKDTLWLDDVQHFAMPLHLKRASGFGTYGGGDGRIGGVWVFEPDAVAPDGQAQLLGTEPGAYAPAVPVAGRLDPVTQVPDPEAPYQYFARVPKWQTAPNTIFRYLTNGGGGWGDAYDREPERVLRDVRDEYVTIEAAARDYGVVVVGDPRWDPEGLRIDDEATAQLRAGHQKG